MTTTIRDITELQDRRIMMEKKLPPFGYALILLTAALMLFLVVWSTKNYYHCLKVRLVLQQPQMAQRAELVRLAPPCPILRVEIIAPLVRMVETHFHVYRIFVFFRVLDNARYPHARKNALATLAD